MPETALEVERDEHPNAGNTHKPQGGDDGAIAKARSSKDIKIHHWWMTGGLVSSLPQHPCHQQKRAQEQQPPHARCSRRLHEGEEDGPHGGAKDHSTNGIKGG